MVRHLLLFSAVLVAIGLMVAAEASGTPTVYALEGSVIGGGGGGGVRNVQIVGTLGQPGIGLTGETANPRWSHVGGFWGRYEAIYTAPAAEAPVALPTRFALALSGPNPVRASGHLQVAVPQAGHVEIGIYNVAGRKVKRILDRDLDPGWHDVSFGVDGLPVGVYLCHMLAPGFSETRRFVLLK